MILIKCLALFALHSLPIIIPIVAATLYLERRAMRRRIIRARAAFADAYDAWKRAVQDPYTGDVPALYESAEKAGWNLAYLKGRNA